MIVGIDSNILIYAGIAPLDETDDSGADDPALDALRKSAKLVLYLHQEDTLVLPTIAVSELLTPIAKERHGRLVSTLAEMFVCPSFDLRSAGVAAQLRSEQKRLPKSEQYSKGERHVLKADAMIVASAVVAGATKFYTSDKKCRRMAQNIVESPEPPSSIPGDLFSDETIRDILD